MRSTATIKLAADCQAFGDAMYRVAVTAQTYTWCVGQNIKVTAIRMAVRAEIQAKFAAMMAERFGPTGYTSVPPMRGEVRRPVQIIRTGPYA